MTLAAHAQMPATARDIEIARSSAQRLARFAQKNEPLTLRVVDSSTDPIELPTRAVHLLMDILENLAAGKGVTLIPQNAELSTVEAAELLNVSRPYLIKLLETEAIPCRKVGKHRRVRMDDVMAYKRNIDRERERVLDQLAEEAQAEDMGY